MNYQLMREVLKKEPLSWEALWKTLQELTIIYEVIPARGLLDKKRKKVKINPAYIHLRAEILMHEILHYLFPGATEWFVRERARELVYNSNELQGFLEQYCRIYAQDSSVKTGLARSIGIYRIE